MIRLPLCAAAQACQPRPGAGGGQVFKRGLERTLAGPTPGGGWWAGDPSGGPGMGFGRADWHTTALRRVFVVCVVGNAATQATLKRSQLEA